MDYKSYLNLINSEEFISLKKYYNRGTIWDALGVARQENPHSSFIRTLLDKSSNQGLGELPFRKLLETICLAKEKLYSDYKFHSNCGSDSTHNLLSPDNKEYFDFVKNNNYTIEEIHVANEIAIVNQRRADIIVAAKLRFPDNDEKHLICLIENKVGSEENTYKISGVEQFQTEIYEKAVCDIDKLNEYVMSEFFSCFANDDNVLILLSYINASATSDIKAELQNWKKSDDKCETLAKSRQFITINYQYILDGVIEPLIKYCDPGSEIYRRLIEYVVCLGQAKAEYIEKSKEDNTSGDDEKYIIMAISESEKKHVYDLWTSSKENQEVFLEILGNIGNNKYELLKEDLKTWKAIAYVLCSLVETDENKSKKRLKIHLENKKDLEIIERARKRQGNTRKHKFIYNGKEYESYKKQNIGRLCYDILRDTMQEWDRKKVESFLDFFRNNYRNWRLVIFDDQVKKLPPNSGCNSSDFAYPCCKEDFERDFLYQYEYAIILSDGTKLFVENISSSDYLEVLLKCIKNFTKKEVQIERLN